MKLNPPRLIFKYGENKNIHNYYTPINFAQLQTEFY
jgi:hypothetical protein